MMAHPTSSQHMKSILGIILIGLGLLMLFANLDAVTASLMGSVGRPEAESVDTLLSLGLAAIHAVQSYTFEPSQFVSGVWQILVSCWPLILVVCGALLLRGTLSKLISSYSATLGSLADGERS